MIVRLMLLIAAGLGLLLFSACEPAVLFSEPQPIGAKNLETFPKSAQGKFHSLTENVTVTIDALGIYKIQAFVEVMHRDSLDSEWEYRNDSIWHKERNFPFRAILMGDSLQIEVAYPDTLFFIGTTNLLRRQKGVFFLNDEYQSGAWIIKMLEVTKEGMVLAVVSTEEDKEVLTQYLADAQDSSSRPIVSPSRKEFRQFVRDGGFRQREELLRVQ
jgi:hypothetical protein